MVDLEPKESEIQYAIYYYIDYDCGDGHLDRMDEGVVGPFNNRNDAEAYARLHLTANYNITYFENPKST